MLLRWSVALTFGAVYEPMKAMTAAQRAFHAARFAGAIHEALHWRRRSRERGARSLSTAVTAALLCGFASQRVLAFEGPADSLQGSISLLSDYSDRGVSKSAGNAALQGEIGWEHPVGVFASLAASSVDFGDGGDATLELHYILGKDWRVGAAVAELEAEYVDYPGASSAYDRAHYELAARVGREIGAYGLDGQTSFASAEDEAGDALYLAVCVSRRFGGSVSLRAQVGRQWTEHHPDSAPDYNEWSIAAEYTRERLQFGVAFVGTDVGQVCGKLCDDRVVVSLRAEL